MPCSQQTPVRSRRRALAPALAALTGVALLTAAPVAGADEPAIDAGGSTFASGVGGLLDSRPGLLIISDVVHAEAGYAVTSFGTTGGSTARAASYFPGDGPLAVPALLCAAAPVCGAVQPPDYPLIAEASHPAKPEAKATVSGDAQQAGPLSTTPGIVLAKATDTGAAAQVIADAVGLAGIVADKAVTESTQAVEGGALTMRAKVVLSGVQLPGGLAFDQVRSEAVVRVLPDRTSTGSAVTTVTGATLGGLKATVSPSGVQVQGQGDGGAVGKAAQQALAGLASAGVQARVLPPATTLEKGKAVASTGGVLVTFARDVDGVSVPVPGVPNPNRTYVGTFNLAAAGVNGFASPVETFADGPSAPELPAPGGGPGASGDAPLPAGPAGEAEGLTGDGAAGPSTDGSAPAVADPPALTGDDTLVAPGSDTAGGATVADEATLAAAANGPVRQEDLQRLALVLLLYPLFVLGAALRREPARLPGALGAR